MLNGCDVGTVTAENNLHKKAAWYYTRIQLLASCRLTDYNNIPSNLHLLWRQRMLALSEQQMVP